MNQAPSVDILLATYNGEKYLAEQLDSILAQTEQNWRLLIRDDRSNDGTVSIVRNYTAMHPEKIVMLEDQHGRLGTLGNFSMLINVAHGDYVMFSDQDDVWLSNKIALSLEAIRSMERRFGKSTPLLAHTDLSVAGPNLEVVHPSLWTYQTLKPTNARSLNRVLVQNVVTGCTTIMNKTLRDLAVPLPQEARMHDWWLALVAVAFGHIESISRPTVLYRQHGKNVVGAKSWSYARVLRLAATSLRTTLADKRHMLIHTQRQADAFLTRYGDRLRPNDRELVRTYAGLAGQGILERRLLMVRHRFLMDGLIKNIGLMLAI